MKAEGRCEWGEGPDLLTLLKKFSKEELHTLYAPLMESYQEEKPEDFKVIEKNLEEHIATLWNCLQVFDELEEIVRKTLHAGCSKTFRYKAPDNLYRHSGRAEE